MNTIYAGTTEQGTAAAETALCAEHNTAENIESFHASDVVGREDCSGNDELQCQECGATASDEIDGEV